ncbi:hypothetical protein I3760_08G154700 [Carya illinoinensis]|nr:hypothetical protein I3760_08G154700 [Carya illinoinensis]
MVHDWKFVSLKEKHCAFFESHDQVKNPPFESSNNNRSSVSALQIQEAANQRLMQTPADTEKKVKLSEVLLCLPPIGLTLSNMAPFLGLDEMGVSHAENTTICTDAVAGTGSHSSCHSGVQGKACTDNKKWKASNFCASFIRIGSWKVVAKREGALVAKCYYAKKKMVWEILKDSLKSKIEIQWSEVLAIRASMVEGQPGILEVELNSPPAFYIEATPRPRKHTLWKNSSDFTDGQALIHRHYLEFPPGALDKHYEKLLQCDSRMLMLSMRPFPSLRSPFFHSEDHFYNGTREFSLDFNRDRPNTSSSNLQSPFSNIVPTPLVDMQQVQAYEQTNQPCFSINDPTGMVMDYPLHLDEIIRNEGAENPMTGMIWGQGMIHSANILGRDQIQEPFSILATSSHHLRDQIQDPYINIPLEIQMNPAIPFQNYNQNYSGSAPNYADEQVGRFSSESQRHDLNGILNQLNPSDVELLQCSDDHDQNRYILQKSIFKEKDGCN